MASIDVCEVTQNSSRSLRSPLSSRLAAWAEAAYRRRQERHTIALLARKDARLLQDIGFEPADIYGALEGTISEVHGDKWRGLDR